MKMKYAFWGALCSLFVTTVVLSQGLISYDQTMAFIRLFESERSYSPQTTGPLLSSIYAGMVENDSPAFKPPLLNIGWKKMATQANNASTAPEADLLYLLYDTRQVTPPNISMQSLHARTKNNGINLIKWVQQQWNKSRLDEDSCGILLVNDFQDFNPSTAVCLVNIVCEPYWQNPNHTDYRQTKVSPAGQNLWWIYYNIRLVELAKRSVAVKLMADHGLIEIPTATVASFPGTAWSPTTIYLEPIQWSSADVPDLLCLLDDPWTDPWFCQAASDRLHLLGYW
jgi:hypothetical protein